MRRIPEGDPTFMVQSTKFTNNLLPTNKAQTAKLTKLFFGFLLKAGMQQLFCAVEVKLILVKDPSGSCYVHPSPNFNKEHPAMDSALLTTNSACQCPQRHPFLWQRLKMAPAGQHSSWPSDPSNKWEWLQFIFTHFWGQQAKLREALSPAKTCMVFTQTTKVCTMHGRIHSAWNFSPIFHWQHAQPIPSSYFFVSLHVALNPSAALWMAFNAQSSWVN